MLLMETNTGYKSLIRVPVFKKKRRKKHKKINKMENNIDLQQ